MYTARFRTPAGSTRTGQWTDRGLEFGGRVFDREMVDILPPSEPTKIVCIGLNYLDHIEETDAEKPERPMLFLKPPNSVAAHGDAITLPDTDRVDHEAELGVVIGEQCRAVDAADALDVVAGYTCVNDLSNRPDQRREKNWVRGKAFDNAAPLGPVIADPETVPADATIECRVNGEVRQQSSIDRMLFSVPELIEEITELITLEPGDVIATGTTAGVSPVTAGDTVTIEIEGIPPLEHDIVD